jgi:hypothetical protein
MADLATHPSRNQKAGRRNDLNTTNLDSGTPLLLSNHKSVSKSITTNWKKSTALAATACKYEYRDAKTRQHMLLLL